MSWLMEPIYHVISWVLLRWHQVWHFFLGDGRFLGTTWSWVLAIVFLVITVRIVLFPIFVKQIKSQRAMQTLAPKVRELRAKYKGDSQTLREEMMKLYQTEKVNPLMGCLPMFLQIPVFFGLFHVLRWINPLQVQNKELYGWTSQLFDSAAQAQLFTAPIPAAFSNDAAHIAALGGTHAGAAKVVAALLVVIMMFTTFVTSRQMIMKTGWQQEPQQRMIQRLMLYGIPASLLLSGWAFPIGVVIYWVTQNLVSLLQQQWVLRKYPPLVTAPEAPKTARERAALANKKEPSALARFFLVLPPPAKPATAVVEPQRPSLFGRLAQKVGFGKGGTELVKPVEPTPRSLAPRPGARPRTAPTSPADTAKVDRSPVDESAADSEPAPAAEEPPAPRRPAGTGKTAGTKVSPTQRPSSSTAGSTGSSGSGARKTPAAGGASANGGSAQPKAGARKATPAKSTTRKGGQSGRKGSGRR